MKKRMWVEPHDSETFNKSVAGAMRRSVLKNHPFQPAEQ